MVSVMMTKHGDSVVFCEVDINLENSCGLRMSSGAPSFLEFSFAELPASLPQELLFAAQEKGTCEATARLLPSISSPFHFLSLFQ